MEEIWKDVVGYEGFYQVSNMGRIKTIYFRGKRKEKIWIGCNDKGYRSITLRKDSMSNNQKIHRLVAKTFIPNPYNKPHINHINGKRNDNMVENLEWCTPKENNQHAYFVLKRERKRKAVTQYTKSGYLIKYWGTIKEASIATGINKATICMCCAGKRGAKSAGGYKWSYS